MSDLPIVFQEEKSYGVKSNSSIQYELDGKLSSDNKAELLEFAKSQTTLYVSRQQVGDLYELQAGEYIMVIDSSGERDKIHFRTINGNFAAVGFFGGLVIACLSFFATVDYPITWSSFGIPFILLLASCGYYIFAERFITRTVRKQEAKIMSMMEKIEKLHSASLDTDLKPSTLNP